MAMTLAELWASLARLGLDEPRRLAALKGDEADTVRAAMGGGHPPADLVAELAGWVDGAMLRAPAQHARRAREALGEALWAQAEQRRVRSRHEAGVQALGRAVEARPQPPAVVKWPTRASQQMASVSAATARAEIEKGELERWADKAVVLLRGLGLPASGGMGAERPVAARRRHCSRGLRAGTLRQHVRQAVRASEWVVAVYVNPGSRPSNSWRTTWNIGPPRRGRAPLHSGRY